MAVTAGSGGPMAASLGMGTVNVVVGEAGPGGGVVVAEGGLSEEGEVKSNEEGDMIVGVVHRGADMWGGV